MISPGLSAIVLFGPPGSGKGTNGRALGTLPAITHYDIGDRLRHFDDNTELGRTIRPAISKGRLLPDQVIIDFFDEDWGRLVDGGYPPEQDVLLLDGLPRTAGQTEALSRRMEIIGAIELCVDDRDELVERLGKRRYDDDRDDDDMSVIETRLERFERERGAVLGRFEPRTVKTIDAGKPPVEVLANVASAMMSLLRTARSV